MSLWVVIAAMTVVAIGALVWPLMRKRGQSRPRTEYDLAVYRDQLGELRADLERGVLTPGEETAARLEVQRRLLRVDEAQSVLEEKPNTPLNAMAAAILLAFVPGLALGLYFWRGAPEVPTQTAADRAALDAATQGIAASGLDTAVANLAKRLEQEPDDLEGWLLLGRSYMILGRYDEAIGTFWRAVALTPDDPGVRAALGEAMVLGADGFVTSAALDVFTAVLTDDPDEPAGRYYLGLAKSQAGDIQGAFDIWLPLARDAPAEAPWLADVIARLAGAADQLDVDLAAMLPDRGALSATLEARPAGPSAEDMAAASAMSPEERIEMISGMVEGLAARLEGSPDDLEGWQRLARSYEVLGEPGKAAAARARAGELRAALSEPAGEVRERAGGPTAEDASTTISY